MHGPRPARAFSRSPTFREGQRTMRPGNRLAAYDLATGREVWSLGGQANGESFDLPLAGSFFFGRPLVDSGELFVVAERDLDVRLYSIDPDIGRVRWSQLLAHSDNKIDQELGRRWWTAQVASSDGILVCPTTVDWLVGVDRLDHSVLWMHRYSARRDRNRNAANANRATRIRSADRRSTINGLPSAPVIAGNRRAVHAGRRVERHLPRPGDRVLTPGGIQRGRTSSIWPASTTNACHSGRGKTTVTALRVETAQARSGRRPRRVAGSAQRSRCARSRNLLSPAARNGCLWHVERSTNGRDRRDEPSARRQQTAGQPDLYRGMMLSLNAYGLTAFEQRDAIERQIAAARRPIPATSGPRSSRPRSPCCTTIRPCSLRSTGSTLSTSSRCCRVRIAKPCSRPSPIRSATITPRVTAHSSGSRGWRRPATSDCCRPARSRAGRGDRQVRRRICGLSKTGDHRTAGRHDSPPGRPAHHRRLRRLDRRPAVRDLAEAINRRTGPGGHGSLGRGRARRRASIEPCRSVLPSCTRSIRRPSP